VHFIIEEAYKSLPESRKMVPVRKKNLGDALSPAEYATLKAHPKVLPREVRIVINTKACCTKSLVGNA